MLRWRREMRRERTIARDERSFRAATPQEVFARDVPVVPPDGTRVMDICRPPRGWSRDDKATSRALVRSERSMNGRRSLGVKLYVASGPLRGMAVPGQVAASGHDIHIT
jgi:hypothetical protein